MGPEGRGTYRYVPIRQAIGCRVSERFQISPRPTGLGFPSRFRAVCRETRPSFLAWNRSFARLVMAKFSLTSFWELLRPWRNTNRLHPDAQADRLLRIVSDTWHPLLTFREYFLLFSLWNTGWNACCTTDKGRLEHTRASVTDALAHVQVTVFGLVWHDVCP